MRLHLFCCFFVVFYFAAIPLATAQHLLQGRVSDKQGMPVVSAVVLLQSLPDSSILKTELTDSNGNYKIQTDAKDKGLIKIVAASYLVAYRKISGTDEIVDITLEGDSKLLKDVVVSARKPLLERKPDRIVFNVESSISAIGSDAMTVLKKAPGVKVHDGEISLAGKSTVNVMINDKLVQLSGDELVEMLSSIPAENLLSIEIITAPPARYDAAGNSGIINIVTKHALSDGFNGNVTAGYSVRSLGSPFGSANVNYKKGRLNAYMNMSTAYFHSIPTSGYTVFYPQQRWEQSGSQVNKYPYIRLQAGADYTIGKRSTLGFLYTLGASSPVNEDDIKTHIIRQSDNGTDSVINTIAKETGSGVRNVLNLNYEYRIDSAGKKLNIDFDYFTRTGLRERELNSFNSFADGRNTGMQSRDWTKGTHVVNIKSIKTDLALPYEFAHFTLGAKASFTGNTSDNIFKTFDSSEYVTDPSRTNKFEYTENTQAMYVSAEKSFGKLGIQAGLRGEYTQTKGYSVTTGLSTSYDYFKLFPSLFAQYTFNEDNALNFNYTRRIGRPDFMLLNPFRVYSTPQSYEAGNPLLRPSYSTNFELGYTLKSQYTFTLFVQKQRSVFAQVLNVDTMQGGYNLTNDNIGSALSYGFSFDGTVNPTPWWESSLELYAYYTRFSSSYYDAMNKQSYSRPALAFSLGNTIFINKARTLSTELGCEYQTRQQSEFDLHYAVLNVQAGLKLLLLRKQMTLGLDAEDIFGTNRYRVMNRYNGAITNNYDDERIIRFSLMYRFGMRRETKRRENTSGIEERKSINNGRSNNN